MPTIFITTLSLRHFCSLKCSHWRKNLLVCSRFFRFSSQKTYTLIKRPCKETIVLQKLLSKVACFTFLANHFAAALISHVFLRLFILTFQTKNINTPRNELHWTCLVPDVLVRNLTFFSHTALTHVAQNSQLLLAEIFLGPSCLSESFSNWLLCRFIRFLVLHLACRLN